MCVVCVCAINIAKLGGIVYEWITATCGGVQCIIQNTTVADLIVLGKCGSNFTGPTSRYSYYHNTLMPEAFHIPCVDAHFSMDVNFTLKSQEYV